MPDYTVPSQTIAVSGMVMAMSVLGATQMPVHGYSGYPETILPYKIERVESTSSASSFDAVDYFARELADIYRDLLGRQEPLGADFAASIFRDLESLYET